MHEREVLCDRCDDPISPGRAKATVPRDAYLVTRERLARAEGRLAVRNATAENILQAAAVLGDAELGQWVRARLDLFQPYLPALDEFDRNPR